MNKRGEMTTQQIVVMIVLIASFAVILFFLAQLALGDETDAELCHNSVVMRGNVASEVADSVPLNCKREAVCLSKSGDCEKMYKPKIIEVNDKIDVYKSLADEIASCWWMFGEGNIDYIGDTKWPQLYCSLCDQVAFDGSVKEIFNENEFDKKEFYYYMTLANISEGESYSQYLFGTNNLDTISKGTPFGKIKLDSQYFILTGMISNVNAWTWAGITSAVAVGGTILFVVSGGAIAVAIPAIIASAGAGGAVLGGGAAYFLAPMVETDSGERHVSPSLIEVGSKEFDDLKCKEIATKS